MPTPGGLLANVRRIAVLTLVSRVLGLVRESLYGYFFSISEPLSAFRIAFMVPNLARRLFGEGALSSALIPVLTDHLKTDGEEASRRFVGSLLKTVTLILVLLVIAVELVIAVWRLLDEDLALRLASLLVPYMAMICIVAVVGGILNVRRHFAAPAAAPIILNVVIILGLLGGAFVARLDGIALMHVLCASVLVAGVCQLILTGSALRLVRFSPSFSGPLGDPQVRRVFRLMGPMVLGLSAVQLNSLADYLIAYWFVRVDGARVGPAVLGYAHYLYQLPLGVFGISLATAIFPILSERAAAGDRPGLADVIGRGVRLALFIAVPASVGLILVARPLVAALLERGQFEAAHTQRVAGTLVFYALGLAAYFTQHVIVRAFYAQHDSRTPARVALWMVGINLLLNLVLVQFLEERGLALATAVCAAIQVFWLWNILRQSVAEIDRSALWRSSLRTCVATAAMASMLLMAVFSSTLASALQDSAILWLAVLVPLGVLTYGIAAALLRMDELRQVLRPRGRTS